MTPRGHKGHRSLKAQICSKMDSLRPTLAVFATVIAVNTDCYVGPTPKLLLLWSNLFVLRNVKLIQSRTRLPEESANMPGKLLLLVALDQCSSLMRSHSC